MHRVIIHSFADDKQSYLHCRRDDTAHSQRSDSHTVIGTLISGLKLNTDKTELLWAGTTAGRWYETLVQDFTFPSMQLAVEVIAPKAARPDDDQ